MGASAAAAAFRKATRGAALVSSLLLGFMFLGTVDAQSELSSERNIISTYTHHDRATNTHLTCHKCPAGTYVFKHCTMTTLRECNSCANGTFTKHENGIEECHSCRKPCEQSMIEKTPCTVRTDRECSCPPGQFLHGDTCNPYKVCPIGWGLRKKGTETEDIRCKPCPRGTFSAVPSSVLRCKPFTNCSQLNMVVMKLGTKMTDNICGFQSVSQNVAGLLSNPGEDEKHYKVSSATFLTKGVNASSSNFTTTPPPSTYADMMESTDIYNETSKNETVAALNYSKSINHQQLYYHKHTPSNLNLQPALEMSGNVKSSIPYKPPKRGPPRQAMHKHFDINEHLPWMIVLLLLLVLVVIVVCSVRKSSRTLKKGPRQDPSAIVEKSVLKKSSTPTQHREKWIYYCNGHGIDILKLVAAQLGSQWKDIYQFLCNASEREVAAFANGYSADHERAYAALQHWTIRGSEASLAQLISALRQHRRTDVVEKIRGLMEDATQLEADKLILPVNSGPLSPTPSPNPKPEATIIPVEPSPLEKNKCFFVDESEPLLRCDSTSSGSSALSRTGSFITKEKKDTVLRQVRLDPCDLQPIFDDMLHLLNPEELHAIEKIPQAEDKLDRLFEIAGVKSQEASQTLLDSVYSHLPDLL
ncbi:tumor necrosis factor receptor superfamily member 21 [Ahaetulla prasina]|uniref:tumor necrosis factor receptor superfamily member 21 n=1 Tax=Ahaetulla prasina TaxID=499056 RepID=UPI002649E1C2|nr:tumor necrosis factor receptor superfamily member 21 [Ahaetulla prasina]